MSNPPRLHEDGLGHLWPRKVPEPSDVCANCSREYDDLDPGERCQDMVLPDLLRLPARQATFEDQWQQFEAWVRKTFESDLARCREKAQEYGSADLGIMAAAMASLLPDGELSRAERTAAGLEMAISFYELGKAARLFGAWSKGTAPGDDSWRDGGIYSYMARFVREHGRWIS